VLVGSQSHHPGDQGSGLGLAPAQHRHGHDARAGGQALAAPGAVLGHLAAELVAEDDRLV
jgi:hypothetical protein